MSNLPASPVWAERSSAELSGHAYPGGDSNSQPSWFVAKRNYPLCYRGAVAVARIERAASSASNWRSYLLSYTAIAVTTRLELAASGLTGRHSDQLSYATLAPAGGFEPPPCGLTDRSSPS